MKKNIFTIAFMAMLLASASVKAQDNIQLPKPSLDNNVTLMQALQNRHSARDFADKQISNDVLSTILWAADGVNRPDNGKLTAPSASNAQDIRIYVIRQDGAYLYSPKDNTLQKASSKDLRASVASRQTAIASAPLALVLVSDHNKFGGNSDRATRVGAVDAGYISQNICLACSALGLNTVPRMTMDVETLKKELNLDNNFDFIINNVIGYPKK